MKNFKVSKKLWLSYIIILIFLGASMIMGVAQLVNMGNKVEAFYSGPFTVQGAANEMDANFEAMQKSVYRAISNTDAEITKQAIADANAAGEKVQAQFAIVKEIFPGDPQIITNLEEDLAELAPHREKVIELAAANQNAEAAEYMETNNISIINGAQKELDSIIAFANDRGETLIDNLRTTQTAAIVIFIILAAVSLVICVELGRYIIKSITTPIQELEAAAKKLSQGEMDAEIEYESEDELGSLADSFRTAFTFMKDVIADAGYILGEIANGNFRIDTQKEDRYIGEFTKILSSMRELLNNLDSTMKQINEGSGQVAIGASQMAENAQSLAEGATEQAGAIEELTATIENVSTMATETAQSSKEAADATRESAQNAEEGRKSMQELVKAMSNISGVSQEIQNIIGAIEDIASQTNLLSLNASIEAARAGEAGKGFAVVADQIGKLASDSADSAVETKNLIIKSLEEVRNGNEITEKTAGVLENIVVDINKFAEIATNVNGAATSQAEMLRQVQEGIEQIATVVQSNSASAEETSATSEELSAQSENLKALVEQFQLKD